MQPVQVKSTNTILTAPEGKEKSVGQLPVTRYIMDTPDGKEPCVMSCWEFSDEELEMIKQTKRIYYHTYGTTHPPMMLTPIPIEDLMNVELQEE